VRSENVDSPYADIPVWNIKLMTPQELKKKGKIGFRGPEKGKS